MPAARPHCRFKGWLAVGQRLAGDFPTVPDLTIECAVQLRNLTVTYRDPDMCRFGRFGAHGRGDILPQVAQAAFRSHTRRGRLSPCDLMIGR